jgi:methylmalonyl-CoA mutase N-terminal domain/subunit
MVQAVKQSYPQREIAEAAFQLQSEIDSGRRIVVGVNAFVREDEQQTPILRIDPALEAKQVGRLRAARAARDGQVVQESLAALTEAAARPDVNLMPPLLDAACARASEGEIVLALQRVWGTYTETPVY